MGCTVTKEVNKTINNIELLNKLDNEIIMNEITGLILNEEITARLEVHISFNNIKSSPCSCFCTVSTRTSTSLPYREVGRTEIVYNSIDPSFITKTLLSYNFQLITYIKFVLYEINSNINDKEVSIIDINRCNTIGSYDTTLQTILSLRNEIYKYKINNNINTYINISIEQLTNSNYDLRFKVNLSNLLTNQSNLFFILSKSRTTGNYTLVYKSEILSTSSSNELAISYNEISCSLLQLCNGDVNRFIKIELMEWNKNGKHSYIAETEFKIIDVLNVVKQNQINTFKLINKHKNKDKQLGLLTIDYFVMTPKISFLDYIKGGTELSFIVAIDFTASNGNPNDPSSLHYINPTNQSINQYEQAIRSIGNIIGSFSNNQQFLCYGFGGRSANGLVNQCFAVNGDDSRPYVQGVDGIIQAYRNALQHIVLSGPTVFSSILNTTSRIATTTSQSNVFQRYYVLLIITDGVVNDLPETVRCLTNMTSLPISVMILGVGDADFTEMKALDKYQSLKTVVEFVSMNEILKEAVDNYSYDYLLTKKLLNDLPTQLVNFYQRNNLQPMG